MQKLLIIWLWWVTVCVIMFPLSGWRQIGLTLLILSMMGWQLWDGMDKGVDYMMKRLGYEKDDREDEEEDTD